VKTFQEGDRVVVEPSFVCGHCFFCQRQAFYLCENLKQLGHQLPGSFAEYTVARATFTYPLPETVSFDKAALTQPLAISIHAMDRAKVEKGQFVAILGMGAIGLLLLQMARLRGARVFASDIVDFKLEKAKTLGWKRRGRDPPGLVDQIRHDTAAVWMWYRGRRLWQRPGRRFCVRRGGTILLWGLLPREGGGLSERVVWMN
jgi:threonine dehydrogenase-like Zn-dependent dehydrogenase